MVHEVSPPVKCNFRISFSQNSIILALLIKHLHIMKNVLRAALLSTFLLACAVSFGQLRKIPAEVTDAFTEKFPNATGVEWRDKLSGFTANFSVDSISYLASFNNKGEWESTEQEITEEELPSTVTDGFQKSKYADWNVSETTRIELPDDEIQYKVSVEKGDIKKRNLYFSETGRLLKDKLTL